MLPFVRCLERFPLYTGARKSEALGTRREHVHDDRAVLPASKSGPRTIRQATPTRACLTDALALAAQSRERQYAIHDATLRGFMLRLQPCGSCSWVLLSMQIGRRSAW